MTDFMHDSFQRMIDFFTKRLNASVLNGLKSHCQPQCIVRPNLLGGHFNGGIIDVSIFNP
jgi:hypothetical protein